MFHECPSIQCRNRAKHASLRAQRVRGMICVDMHGMVWHMWSGVLCWCMLGKVVFSVCVGVCMCVCMCVCLCVCVCLCACGVWCVV